ncbi:MAG: DUF58 domain-containing protein [Vicinamibacterales bacterium]
MTLRLDHDFLTKLEYLHVVSKRAFAGQHRADRLAQKRGRGLEFADHRAYSAGDDFRHIDWKAYKRLNRLLLRLFDEEQDLPIYLLIDISRSMAEAAKFDHARRIAAALCYVGLAHLDHVTLVPFAGGLGREINPGRGKGRIFRVLQQLDALDAGGTTDLAESLKQFSSRRRRTGLCVVISDFLDPKGPEDPVKMLSVHGHEVFAIHVTSRHDSHCDVYGEVRLLDIETGRTQDIDVTPAAAAAHHRAFEAHAAALAQFCARYRLGYIRADVSQPFEDIVLNAFRSGQFLA